MTCTEPTHGGAANGTSGPSRGKSSCCPRIRPATAEVVSRRQMADHGSANDRYALPNGVGDDVLQLVRSARHGSEGFLLSNRQPGLPVKGKGK